ncbi:MAG TPA: methyltransferase domain-containing protein [Candidatus Limnocylindria bacterium]|jgi:SAM-dependent methyltransferase|nr:methyltransferase domain-containing protein [Candidatus Limnocylindria bacterium]
MTTKVTRGHGLLEGFLARQRTRQAQKLIGVDRRHGRVLDIGCGSFPLFLASTSFAEKFGLDRVAVGVSDDVRAQDVKLIEHDLASGRELPFPPDFFDVVTMLAVFEHVDPDLITNLVREVRRVLRRGGVYVMTTPSYWTEGLLKLLAGLGMVSREELDEHTRNYRHPDIRSILLDAGFAVDQVRLGYFEAAMNTWATAVK